MSAEGATMEATGVRRIAALMFPDVVPATIAADGPRFESIDPRRLTVDDRYQRNLSERSIRLIRKIVAEWDWRRFKPPVVVQIGDAFHLIDGQHTAIAAASHPGIATIPVMMVDAPEMADRAKAFVGHNRDRITVTGTQLHHALLAAGDEDAQNVQQVCDRAGVKLLKYPPTHGVFSPGETLALASIRTLINKHGVVKARVILQLLRESMVAPVSADLIKASAELLYAKEYEGAIAADDLGLLIRSLGGEAERDARQLAMAKGLPLWRALVIVLFQRRRGRGSRSAA